MIHIAFELVLLYKFAAIEPEQLRLCMENSNAKAGFFTGKHKYRDMSLWKKMLVGYFVLIALPFFLFVIALLSSYQSQKYEKYLADEQRMLQHENISFANRLSQTQGYHNLVQKERAIINYMTGYYSSESDELFHFTSDIRPLFSYLLASDEDILDAAVYTMRAPIVPLSSGIIHTQDVDTYTQKLSAKGNWTLSEDTEGIHHLQFRAPIFTADYYKRIGYFEITLKSNVASTYFISFNKRSALFLFTGEEWYYIAENLLYPVDDVPDKAVCLATYLQMEQTLGSSFRSKGYLVNEIHLDDLDGMLVSLTPERGVSGLFEFRGQLSLLFALFALLSVIYYLLISSFTKRLLKFSRHIETARYHSLEPYEEPTHGDEIGKVIHAYNQLILRIRTLVNDLNLTQMKKNEADYFALQAQIKPHFIYNSLETARMLAEVNDDEDVSDFLFNLGGVMRYTFSSASTQINLEKELETVRKYLEIYQISSGGSIRYTIDAKADFSMTTCPPFILQPLVENSIHHAIRPENPSLHIRVSAKKEAGRISLCVADDGAGMDEETLETIRRVLLKRTDSSEIKQKGSGLGLRSVIKRLWDYYGENVQMTVKRNNPCGTVIVIVIKEAHE